MKGLTFFAILLILSTLGLSAQCFVDCAVPQCAHHPKASQPCGHSFVASEVRTVHADLHDAGPVAPRAPDPVIVFLAPVADAPFLPPVSSESNHHTILRI